MRDQRILIYSNLPSAGGVSTHVCLLAEFLLREGAQVWIASLGRDLFDAKGQRLREIGARLVTTALATGTPGYSKQLHAIFRWPLELRPRRFDRVVGFGPGGFFALLAPLKKRGGLTIYNEVNAGKRIPGPNGVLHHLMLRGVDAIGCLSQPIVTEFLRNHGSRTPVRVLPYFTLGAIDLPRVEERFRGGAEKVLRVAYFGRLESYKQPDLLIDIWEDLAIGPARLAFYGSGSLEATLQQAIASRNLGGQVMMHGSYDQRDLGGLMQQCDLVVLPSAGEGFGLVLLEAIAHGVPFVTTALGGAVDLAAAHPNLRAADPTRLGIATAIREVASSIRAGLVSPRSLQGLYRRLYGYDTVAEVWRQALDEPRAFWGLPS